jgi:hypothetical protein
MGIVPDDCVATMTAGRDRELAMLRTWLTQQYGTALIVGDYGSGKSHMLRYLEVKAIEAGYAVAWVQLDPNETPLYKPKRIYADVARSLRYRALGEDRTLGFRDLLMDSLGHGQLQDHMYFALMADDALTEDRYVDMFWEWIEASDDNLRPVDWEFDVYGTPYNRFSYVPPIYTHTTAANLVCYLLSGLSWAAVHSVGLKGLLVLVDEAETMDMSASPTQIQRGQNLLRGLVRTAEADPKLLGLPQYTGLNYSGMGIGPRVPFLYRRDCYLSIAFGFTPTPALSIVPEFRSSQRIDLDPLDRSDLATLFDWVWYHYARAYGMSIPESSIARFRDILLDSFGNIRSFTKGSIEVMDYVRS